MIAITVNGLVRCGSNGLLVSAAAIELSAVLFTVTRVLRYEYDAWWPAGIVTAAVCKVSARFLADTVLETPDPS